MVAFFYDANLHHYVSYFRFWHGTDLRSGQDPPGIKVTI